MVNYFSYYGRCKGHNFVFVIFLVILERGFALNESQHSTNALPNTSTPKSSVIQVISTTPFANESLATDTPLTTFGGPTDPKVTKEVIKSTIQSIKAAEEHKATCPPLEPSMDHLTQEEFTSKLTDSCRYDRLIKPITNGPLQVYLQVDMRHIENIDQLQFKTHLLVQLRYVDNRLRYEHLSPNRGFILGEEPLRSRIWVPHLIVRNEKDTSLMGMDRKDVFVSVSPTGNVIYSYRMTATFYCWMNLQKFPFDSQICEIMWVSWAYNHTQINLNWEKENPFIVASNLHLTEFSLDDRWTIKAINPGPFTKGGMEGNYSAVIFRFKLRREVGYYIMDYFLPSMLLVFMSWVSFWLQADASPPRVTLGTSTMLAFITLNGGVTKNLPKVSYIKASEIWFLGCACFIFCSMAEFAFVNVIWRRKKKVEVKKANSKHILKGALTPSLARKQLRKAESVSSLYKTRSCSSLNSGDGNEKSLSQTNYLTVHVPTITTQSQDDLVGSEESVTTIPIPENGKGGGSNGNSSPPPAQTWTTMTPHEVANWIDKKSRMVFPIAFLIFNLFYWSFVYAL